MERSLLDSDMVYARKVAAHARVPVKWVVNEADTWTVLRPDPDEPVEAWMERVRDEHGLSTADAFFLYYAHPRPGVSKQYTGPRSLKQPKEVDFSVWKGLDDVNLEHRFEAWRSAQERTVQDQKKEIDQIITQQTQLLSVDPLPVSPFAQATASYLLPVTFQAIERLADGLDVFNEARVSDQVPFLTWRPVSQGPIEPNTSLPEEEEEGEDESEARIRQTLHDLEHEGRRTVGDTVTTAPVKVFRGLVLPTRSTEDVSYDRFNAALQWPLIESERARVKDVSALFVSVLAEPLSSTDPDAREITLKTKDAYTVVSLQFPTPDLTSAVLSVRSTAAQLEQILDRLRRSLASVGFDADPAAATITRLTGTVSVYQGELDREAFSFLIATDPLFHSTFYVEESTYVQEDKERFTLHFKGKADEQEALGDPESNGGSLLSATITQMEAVQPEDIILSDGKRVRLPAGTPTLVLRIGRAKHRAALTHFIEVFRRAIRLVHAKAPAIRRFIQSALPVARPSPRRKKVNHAPAPVESDMARIQQLKKAAPEIFVSRYARLCQKHKPKILTRPEEVDEWTTRGHQIMTFPKTDAPVQPASGPLTLVCDHTTLPFPGVRASSLANNAAFPYYPCCFSTNQMVPGTDTYAYYKGGVRPDETRAAARGHIMTTQKALAPGQLGVVSAEAQALFGPHAGKVYRIGLPKDPNNSILHALLLAQRDPSYLAARTTADKNEVVATLRHAWFDDPVDRSWIAQERFDLSDRLDDHEPIDTWTWYRALEERAGINLFVFEEGEARLQVPRHLGGLARTLKPDRPTVVVVQKHTADQGRRVPVYELMGLVEEGKVVADGMRFAPETGVGRRLLSALFETHHERTWTPFMDLLPPTQVDLVVLLAPYPITAQTLDATGHLRGIRTDDGFVYEVWPAQPLADVPVVSPHDPRWSNRQPTVDAVLVKHGLPSAVDRWTPSGVDSEIRVVGLFYPLGAKREGIYVACVPAPSTPLLDRIPMAVPGALQSVAVIQDRIGDLYVAKKTMALLSQWTTWAWAHVAPAGQSVTEFLIQHADVVGPKKSQTESLSFYTPLPLLRVRPAGPFKAGELTAFLTQHWPAVFTPKGNIRFPSTSFLTKWAAFLERVVHFEGRAALKRQHRVQGVFLGASDFTPQPETQLFTDLTDFQHWHAEQQRTLYAKALLTSEQKGLSASLEGDALPLFPGRLDAALLHSTPFPLVVAWNQRTWLVQNVVGGDLDRALAVCLAWHSGRTNVGYRAAPIEGGMPAFSLVERAADGQLREKRVDPDAKIWILETSKGGRPYYTALLPLPQFEGGM